MQGFVELKTAKDLLNKLRHEFSLLKEKPNDTFIAFNFFVTGYHILDWLYPGDESKHALECRNSSVLRACRHICNGAKHFEATRLERDANKKAVSDITPSVPFLPKGFLPEGFLSKGFLPEDQLIIHLEGQAAIDLKATTITAIELAEQVLDFWEKHPDIQALP